MTKLRLGQIDTSDIESSVFASANTLNLVQSNLTANIYNTYTSLSANIDSVQANVYAITLDTVATNGNSTTQSIEVAGLLVNGTTDLTSNVVIRGMIDTVDRIQFNTSVNTDTTAGVFAWNADQGTLQFGLSDAASVHLGQDTFYYVKAGEALSRGNVVYASGAVGNSGHIEVSKFYANNAIDERYVVGVMADDVASGEFGYATVIGTIRGIVADGSLVGETWNLGDVLYPSPTNPGALTNIQPEAPNQDIAIAFITSNAAVNGSIAVRATAPGFHLGEIHDVQTGTESNGDVLTWVSSNSRWEPKTVASDQSNVYNTYLTLSANDYSTYDTLTANIYNTYNTLNTNLLSAVEEDSTPSLGGNLTLNSYSIVGTGDINITGSLTADSANLSNFTISDTLTVGSQIIYAQGNNGFSVNEDFDPSNNALQTAYHFTSGAGRETVAFTLARTAQFTDGFGIYGTSANNSLVMFGEQTNTNFEWRKGVGIRPLDLDGGTLLMRLTNGGDLTILGNLTSADLSNAWVNANDFSTYNTLSSLIDTVQDNVSAQTSNTSIIAGGVDLANTTVFIEAGDGVLLSSNTTSKTLTIATSMSNVTSQTISIDGSANSFTLTKSASNSNMILVMYNGLVQDPARYTISGSTLTLINSAPLIAGANVEVRYFDFFSLPGVSESGGGGSYSFQGSTSGYTSGGASTPPFNYRNTIDKFPFSADGNATDVGDLTIGRYGVAGQSSDSFGYTTGGSNGTFLDTIDKFSFTTDGNATDVGDLTQARVRVAGQSSSDRGYTSGGRNPVVDTIDKFPFSTDGNATDVGNLTVGRYGSSGQSSSSSGYTSGGVYSNVIDKFPFAADSSATDVGDLTVGRHLSTGQSSTVSGYASGGTTPPSLDIIDKFPFATDSNATDVGNLTAVRLQVAGQSSTSSGYTTAGSPAGSNVIDKFPFAADANATDVGDLTQGRYSPAGQQV